jgi:hypothetical protein
MKKILIMALTGLTYFSAGAQKTTEVCRMTKDKKTACYHTKYSENFKVCKNGSGYFICGEAITNRNSTKGAMNMPAAGRQMVYNMPSEQQQDQPVMQVPDQLTAPQSQSYPSSFAVNTTSSYEGYYPQKHYISVSYDNVAEDNRAPYEGLPSPQDDGPAKNAERNLNESNPNANLAPITGRKE